MLLMKIIDSQQTKIMDTDISEEYSASFFRMGMGMSASFRSYLTLLIPVHFSRNVGIRLHVVPSQTKIVSSFLG